MKLNSLKIILLFFLSTGFINNADASNALIFSDTTTQDSFFEAEIQKDAQDSIRLDIINQKAYLYGSAKIKYQQTTITAAYIEIDWIKNTIFATTTLDSLGNKIGYPIFTEGNENFKAHEITYNFKSKSKIFSLRS